MVLNRITSRIVPRRTFCGATRRGPGANSVPDDGVPRSRSPKWNRRDDAADAHQALDDLQRGFSIDSVDRQEANDVRRLLSHGTADFAHEPSTDYPLPEGRPFAGRSRTHPRRVPRAVAAVMVGAPALENADRQVPGSGAHGAAACAPSEDRWSHPRCDTEPVSDPEAVWKNWRALATPFVIVPIVNESHRLVGAVTIGDVLDALTAEDAGADDGTVRR